MQKFLSQFPTDSTLKILDVGSLQVRPKDLTYKILCPPVWSYIGLDLIPGRNVDIIAPDSYEYPFHNSYFDIIISGQTLEHVECPQRWLCELYRITKLNGHICIIAPSQGPVHHSPDYRRILPDGMYSLLSIAGYTDIKTFLNTSLPWYDCVGIGKAI